MLGICFEGPAVNSVISSTAMTDIVCLLQDCYSGNMYKYIAEDNNMWMLFDPTVNGQNAQRIIEVWQPLVMQFPQGRQRLLSLYCTFHRASKIASDDSIHIGHAKEDVLLWKSMAAIPAGVLCLIAIKAGMTLGVETSVASQ